MSKVNNYILKNFFKQIKELNYTVLENDTNWQFRYMCYKLNHFMKHIPLPIIRQKNFYEAVFIEFRILPNIEFIIRNAILKLASEWSYTIICGKLNYNYMREVVKNIDRNISIICLDCNNITQQEYSNLLTTKNFWNLLYGEKILIYQEDSLIFHNNILPFLEYDYIGAPFLKSTNDTPNCVGNGGLSLRTKYKMLEVIDKCNLKSLRLNSSTLDYMRYKNLTEPPEDVYFSKNMQELNIGEVADWNTAFEFSSEQVFNNNSFGGHKYWISNNNWQIFTLKLFNYYKYIPKSNLNKYLHFKNIPLQFNKTTTIKNAFDIDLKFFCYVNNINYTNDYDILVYMSSIGLDGFIYHPKQLYNIFESHISFYSFLNNLYTFYHNEIYTIQDFVNRYVYNSNFDYLSQLLIKKKYDTINNNYDTILLVFLGNVDIALDLLSRIIQYKKINKEFNVAFCINKNIVKEASQVKKIIKNNFDFYAIYYSNELGTDITPTLLMYNDISKSHYIKHILKFHTKTISNVYNDLTNYLLQNPLNKIIEEKKINCNCIGPYNSYISLSNDVFNNRLKMKHSQQLNMEFQFVGGTIFYAENIVFEKVIEFLKNSNYRSYFLNNLYENNSINKEFSPIHFLERVFGVIKL
jgi:hypothetical protein